MLGVGASGNTDHLKRADRCSDSLLNDRTLDLDYVSILKRISFAMFTLSVHTTSPSFSPSTGNG